MRYAQVRTGRFSPEGIETGDHLDEDLLAGVARILGTGGHAQREPEYVILHGANHAFEREAIACARGGRGSRQEICIDVSLDHSGHSISSKAFSTVSS